MNDLTLLYHQYVKQLEQKLSVGESVAVAKLAYFLKTEMIIPSELEQLNNFITFLRLNNTDVQIEPDIPIANSYMWDGVILPEKTILRIVYKKISYDAIVFHGKLVFNSVIHTPASFASTVMSSNSGAKKAIWVLFPDSDNFVKALTLFQK